MPNDWLNSFHSPSLPHIFKSMQMRPLLTAFQFAHNLTSCRFFQLYRCYSCAYGLKTINCSFVFHCKQIFLLPVARANCNSNNRFSASRSKTQLVCTLSLPINRIRRLSECIPFDCAIEAIAQQNIWRNMTFMTFFCFNQTQTLAHIRSDINWARIQQFRRFYGKTRNEKWNLRALAPLMKLIKCNAFAHKHYIDRNPCMRHNL